MEELIAKIKAKMAKHDFGRKQLVVRTKKVLTDTELAGLREEFDRFEVIKQSSTTLDGPGIVLRRPVATTTTGGAVQIKYVNVPVEKVVYKEKIVEKPVEKIVYKDKIVEKIVYKETEGSGQNGSSESLSEGFDMVALYKKKRGK